MHTVEDERGRRYVLEKRSAESSRVRDVLTGERRHLPNERLTDVEGVDPLEAAAEGVPQPIRRLVSAVHGDRGLGLLLTLAHGPTSAAELLEATTLCESDMLGLVTSLRAADLVEETTVSGERGYALTADAREALATIQSALTPNVADPD